MKQRINNIYLILIVAVMAVVPVVARAQADSTSSYLLMPLVFDKQQSAAAVSQEPGKQQPGLKVDDTWIDRAQQRWGRTHDTRYRLMINKPELVPFNENVLPKPPKEVVVETSPADAELQVEPRNLATEQFKPIDRREVKVHNWLHSFVGSLQGTQAYISNNWYQGGENNLNLLADVQWDCNLNQKLHPNWLFNNTLHYKLGVATAKGDTLRNYSINEDNFQFSSQVGYKAVKNWYYSATLFFKTQLLNSYVTNSKTLAASLLSSGELNLGLGMTYNYKDQEGYKTLTLSIAPLSYNMKICRDIEKIDPTKFGIEAGHHFKHSFGSTVEMKFEWKITPSINWKTRLYAFTDYKYVQGDWENTLDLSIGKYLTTQLFTHLRFDRSRARDDDWNYWQFKEILSLGIIYRFATVN